MRIFDLGKQLRKRYKPWKRICIAQPIRQSYIRGYNGGQNPPKEAIKGKKKAGWNCEVEDLVKTLNLGTFEDPKLVNITKGMCEFEVKFKDLFLHFKDVSHLLTRI